MGLLTFLTGCFGGIDGKNYVQQEPTFKLEEFFTGNIKAWGIIQDYSGNVTNRFEADMVGSWEGNNGTLEEVFRYYDSPLLQNRTWRITKLDDLTYEGRAGDILGVAQGQVHGSPNNLSHLR